MGEDKEAQSAVKELFQDSDFVRNLQSLIESAVSRALEQRDAKIAELEIQLATARRKLSSVQDRLSAVERQMELMEVESRKNCVVISGVPELPEESTGRLAVEVAQAAGVPLSAGDLDRCHRLGRQRGTIDKPRAILVRLQNYGKRQELFNSRKELSAHRVPNNPVLTPLVLQDVYLTDFLTAKSQHLLFICRQLKNRKQMWAAYSTNGRVKVRIGEHQPARIINDVEDLETLLGPNNKHLKEIMEACNSHTPRSPGQAAAVTAEGGGSHAPRPSPHRPASDPPTGAATIKGRKQPQRQASHPR